MTGWARRITRAKASIIQLEVGSSFWPTTSKTPNGGLAQLGERLPCKQEVTGSIPVLSTITQEIDWSNYEVVSLSFLKEEFKNAPWKLNIVIIDAIMRRQQ